MRSEFLYPTIADRSAPDVWCAADAKDIHDVACDRVRAILSRHYPAYIDANTDAEIRSRFPIRLRAAEMRRGNGRW
jgi:trimethylamine--corrinoid protein Co-methyltransferase